MADNRENLRPYVNKRVPIRGIFQKWDQYWIENYKQVGRVCITFPEIDNEVVCDYVWVVNVPHWKEHQDAVGSQVTFDAIVKRYTSRRRPGSYCLGNAGDLTVLNPPAVRIPDPPKTKPTDEPLHKPEPDHLPEPSIAILDPLEKVRQVKSYCKAGGGYEQVEKVLTTLPPIPIPELLEFIRALKE